tara:strand:+ start:1928 stop:2062 length:135 start_codon:yes stop_codon:yes gene_type:complete
MFNAIYDSFFSKEIEQPKPTPKKTEEQIFIVKPNKKNKKKNKKK